MNFTSFDWIQWYVFVLLVIGVIMLLCDTAPYQRTYQHRVVSMVMCIPYVGRILGWW